jgi:hypothetical protein
MMVQAGFCVVLALLERGYQAQVRRSRASLLAHLSPHRGLQVPIARLDRSAREDPVDGNAGSFATDHE